MLASVCAQPCLAGQNQGTECPCVRRVKGLDSQGVAGGAQPGEEEAQGAPPEVVVRRGLASSPR